MSTNVVFNPFEWFAFYSLDFEEKSFMSFRGGFFFVAFRDHGHHFKGGLREQGISQLREYIRGNCGGY